MALDAFGVFDVEIETAKRYQSLRRSTGTLESVVLRKALILEAKNFPQLQITHTNYAVGIDK